MAAVDASIDRWLAGVGNARRRGRLHGNRIFTSFTITRGTGEFDGATGGGLEFGNGGAPVTYNGQIDR